jgi:hypothetical protein
MSGLKQSANFSGAASYAGKCRTSPPPKGAKLAPGPRAEPVKVNGVPLVPQKGLSKK